MTMIDRETVPAWVAGFFVPAGTKAPTVFVRAVQVERRQGSVLIHNDDGTVERHYDVYRQIFDSKREARDWIAANCEAVAASYAAVAREYRG